MRRLLSTAIFVLASAMPAAAGSLLDVNGDGVISRSEFHDYIAKRHALRDRSHDGEVRYYELVGRYVGGNDPFSPADARRFMSLFDLDRSGGVSLREMIFVIEYSGAFDVVDRNDDGVIDASEARGIRFLNMDHERKSPIILGLDPK